MLSAKQVLLFLAAVAPSSAGIIAKRNPCDGVDAKPELYHDYHADECPPKNKMDKDGHCLVTGGDKMECERYCEVRTKVRIPGIIYLIYKSPLLPDNKTKG